MGIQVNEAGVNKARALISGNQYVKDSDWSEVQASADQENEFLDAHGWQDYAAWFLAVDTEEAEDTKARYKFPYGDFRRVHRSALVAAKQRAGSEHYGQVERAADDLLSRVPGE